MRRAMAVLAAAAAGAVLLVGAPVGAQVPPPWQGQWDAAASTFDDASSHPIKGWLSHVGFQTVTVTVRVTSSDKPEGCADPSTGSSSTRTIDGSRTREDFTLGFLAECNGTYVMGAVGSVSNGCDVPNTPPCRSDEVLTTVSVARAAPAVTGVKAASNANRAVIVTWDALGAAADTAATPLPKDLTGFVVTRSDGTTTQSFTVDDPAATSYTDPTLPAAGGAFTYAVSATRFNVAPSEAAAAAPVTIAAVPGATTTAPPATDPAAGGAGGGGGGATGPSPTVRSGGAGASRNPGAPSATVPSGFDAEGFSSDLPYEAEPGGVAAQLPSGDGGEGFSVAGAGLLVPFAVALLLAVWGLHILYVTKSAREADEALALLHLELE